MKTAKTTTKMVLEVCKSNSPAILTGLAVAGVIATSIFVAKAVIKADKAVEVLKEEQHMDEEDKLPAKVIVKTTWKHFVPPVIMGGLTIACIVGAQAINTKRLAALTALYSISEKTLKEYQDAATEEQHKKVTDKLTQDANVDCDWDSARMTQGGVDRFVDYLTGQPFFSSAVAIKEGVSDFNNRLCVDGSCSLNELYEILGIDTCGIGDTCGWGIGDHLTVSLSSRMDSRGHPVGVVSFRPEPRYSYNDW